MINTQHAIDSINSVHNEIVVQKTNTHDEDLTMLIHAARTAGQLDMSETTEEEDRDVNNMLHEMLQTLSVNF